MPFSYQTFYHLSSELLVHYSRHGLNNGPFNERTVLEHLNTKLVFYSDPHCTGLVHNLDPLCSLCYDFCQLQSLPIAVKQLVGQPSGDLNNRLVGYAGLGDLSNCPMVWSVTKTTIQMAFKFLSKTYFEEQQMLK